MQEWKRDGTSLARFYIIVLEQQVCNVLCKAKTLCILQSHAQSFL